MRLYTILNKLSTLVNQHTTQISELNSKLKYQELYGASVDLNDAALNTWYWVYQSATNAPDQGALFTYGYTSRKSQILFAYNAIYVRMYSSNNWGNWYKVTGTAVS